MSFTKLSAAIAAIAALAASSTALADMPGHHIAKARMAGAQPGAQSALSAARSAEGGRDAWQGKAINELIIDHQRWLFSIPFEVSPAGSTETGANCGINQNGPAWFMSGPGGLPVFTVNCNIPSGKAIFMPAIGYLYDYPCPAPYPQLPAGQNLEAFLSGLSADFIDGINLSQVTLDGKAVKVRRAATGVFRMSFAKDWAAHDDCATGSPQLAQADGLWVLIDPPSVGKHTLKMNVSHAVYGALFDGTWNINVVK